MHQPAHSGAEIARKYPTIPVRQKDWNVWEATAAAELSTEPAGTCGSWCTSHASDWPTKCGFANCNGCDSCRTLTTDRPTTKLRYALGFNK